MNLETRPSNYSAARPENQGAGRRSQRAFTLIEVLLTIAIFAVILAAIDGVLFAALRLQNHAEDAVGDVLPAGRAIEFIKRDIAGIVPMNNSTNSSTNDSSSSSSSSSTNSAAAATNFVIGPVVGGTYSGTNSLQGAGLSGVIKLEMFTATGVAGDGDHWCEIERVDYSLQPSVNRSRNEGGFDLVRCVSHNPFTFNPEIPDLKRLIGGLQDMQVTFFDGTNWQGSWGNPDTVGTSNLPTAIKIKLYYYADRNTTARSPLELLYPVPTALVNTNLN